jgi:hypothetical protein
MEKSSIAIALLSMMLVRAVNAQTDTSDHSTGKPKPELNQGPSQTKQSPSQAAQFKKEDRIIVERDKLPDALRQTLEEGQQYRGWDHSTIYFDRTTKEYILTLTDPNSTRTFRFDESGKPVTNDSPAKKQDQ